MAIIPPNNDITEILDAFGLKDLLVTQFQLNIEVDDVVTAKIKFLVKDDSTKELKKVLKKYKLVERKVIDVEL